MRIKMILFCGIISILALIPLLAMGEVTVLTSPSLPQHYLDFIQNKVNFFFFYPEEAAKQGWQGQVEISLLLDSEGNVKDTKITQNLC